MKQNSHEQKIAKKGQSMNIKLKIKKQFLKKEKKVNM
jgi:hypothetical protein